jgi:hypothetical protein
MNKCHWTIYYQISLILRRQLRRRRKCDWIMLFGRPTECFVRCFFPPILPKGSFFLLILVWDSWRDWIDSLTLCSSLLALSPKPRKESNHPEWIPGIVAALTWQAPDSLLHTGCSTSRGTLLLRVVSQLSVNQYFSAWAHFKALFVLYTFDK